LVAAAFAGKDGGRLRGIADPLIIVPCDETARIQEMHILLGHILCAEIENRLGLA
jgi:D-sedoheptulose 7-phosphate isomerase